MCGNSGPLNSSLSIKPTATDGMSEYTKTFDDELDWNLLDQLHKVVLQISTFCFRTKQICLTVLIAVAGLLVKFTGDKLDTSVFVAGLVIPLCFWFLDSVAYYYQVKIRGMMDNIRERLRERNTEQLVQGITHERVIDNRRVDQPQYRKILGAFFNHSMWMYCILIVIDTVLWFLFARGTFQ